MNNDSTIGPPSLRTLASLVLPPAGGGNVVDWDRMTADYGHGFPDDFKAFMGVYGEGCFDDFLGVFPPIEDAYPGDASATVRGVTADAQLTAEHEEYEEPDLLIGWGVTTGSDLLCWHAADTDPNQWPTVIWRRHWAPPDCWMRFDCGMVELLCRYVKHQIPDFWISDLRYPGSRFVHSKDGRRYRRNHIDPWGPDPVTE